MNIPVAADTAIHRRCPARRRRCLREDRHTKEMVPEDGNDKNAAVKGHLSQREMTLLADFVAKVGCA
jgi:hypothetical protein